MNTMTKVASAYLNYYQVGIYHSIHMLVGIFNAE